MASIPTLPSLQVGLPPLSLVGNVDPSVPAYLLKLSQIINSIIEFLKRLGSFPLIFGTGQVSISGSSSTSSTVTFTTVMPDTNYQFLVNASGFTGTPNAGAFAVSTVTKTVTGATFSTIDQPGSGNSVTFDWAAIHA